MTGAELINHIELAKRFALLLEAAEEVVAFDWSDNDEDAVAYMDCLRETVRQVSA